MKLIHRMKILMAVVQELGGDLPATRLQRLLFLYCHKFIEHNHYYDFIPQPFGPFSLQAEADKDVLIKKKCLESDDNWIASAQIERFAVPLDFFEKIAIQQLKNQWEDQSDEALEQAIKQEFPEYFIIENNLTANDNTPVFYTIGYEGLSPEKYVNTLLENKVRLLCDVRKNAFSQKYGFSKNELKNALERVGIAYKHMPELGIISEKRAQLETDRDYRLLFDEYEKETLSHQQHSLDTLTQLLKDNTRIAITCFEAKVCHCHRGRVATALKNRPDFTYKVEHL